MSANLTISIPEWLDRVCAWPVVVYRKHKYGYTYRKISLGERKFTIVDPADYYRFNIFNWCPNEDGMNIYAVRLVSVPERNIRIVSLHREIMNHPKGLLVDHKNRDGLDNRRANLRVATKSQNTCNRRKKKNATSRYFGVHFDKRHSLWAANIKCRGKRIWLGYFDNEIDAAKAYDAAAKKYHGEFARLNFPDKD